jgi:NADPH2:quinone reductase
MSASETAILLRDHGGPDQLRIEPLAVSDAGAGELRIRHSAISVNFHDTYVRTGQYRTLALPGVPGIDAVGIVEQVGAGVTGFSVGDRIAYIDPTYGAYSSARLLPAAKAFRLPDGLGDVAAAATLLRGATVAMLVDKVHAIKPGDRVLVQAAAGGVGRLLCSWARHLGAFVIGTAGSAEKAAIARAAGAHEMILYRQEDVAARVLALTGGAGVRAVYDSCGQDTFEGSLRSLDYCGHLVLFGQSSGPVPPFAPGRLAERSLTVSRPILFHYMRDDPSARAIMAQTFYALAGGVIAPVEATTFPLAEAAAAHRMLEGRASPGAIILLP